MSVTVTGDTIHDVRSKLGMGSKPSAIKISFHNGYDFGRTPEPGCIVDATECATDEKVAKSFDTYAKAIQYLKTLLKQRDKWVAQERKKLSKKPNGKAHA